MRQNRYVLLIICLSCFVFGCSSFGFTPKGVAQGAQAHRLPPPAYDGVLMMERSVGELTTEADRILVADVLQVDSQFSADKKTIQTLVQLKVLKVFKGKAAKQETLILPGGQVGTVRMLVGGVPFFVTGERTLLFLDDHSPYVIQGMWQGKYSLSGEDALQAETGKSIATQDLEVAIGNALRKPVAIGSAPAFVHATFTTSCTGWHTNQMPVSHLINAANAGSGAPSGSAFSKAVYDALNAWQALPNSWIAQGIAGTTGIAASVRDGQNVVYWGELTAPTLGINTCFTSGPVVGNENRDESDTIFDNVGVTWSVNATAGTNDFRAVAEHEFGHGIGIGHSDQFCDGLASTPLMCPAIQVGVRKTILADDSNAAAFIYPLSGAVPNAPSGLSVSPSGSGFALTWSDNASNEFAFEIQRASGDCSGTFVGVATVNANTTSFTDTDYGLGLTGSFCYRVKALNQGGDSGFSNAAATSVTSTSTPTSTPTNTPTSTSTTVPNPSTSTPTSTPTNTSTSTSTTAPNPSTGTPTSTPTNRSTSTSTTAPNPSTGTPTSTPTNTSTSTSTTAPNPSTGTPTVTPTSTATSISAPPATGCSTFSVYLSGANEVPRNPSTASGSGLIQVDTDANQLRYAISHSGLSGAETAAHIHGFAAVGANAPVLFPLPLGDTKTGVISYDQAQEAGILAGLTYVNIHSTGFPGGEIRGQILTKIGDCSTPPPPATGNGKIQVRAYYDFNGSHAREKGEIYLPGWEIKVTNLSTNATITRLTNKSGKAEFKKLAAGSYQVCQTLLAGWVSTQPIGSPCYTVTIGNKQTASLLFGSIYRAVAATVTEADAATVNAVQIVEEADDAAEIDWENQADEEESDTAKQLFMPIMNRE